MKVGDDMLNSELELLRQNYKKLKEKAEKVVSLAKKIEELKQLPEVKEYLEDNNVEELADIVEVIYGILNSMDVSIKEFEKIRINKQEQRGAFEKKIYLEEAE